MMNTDASPDLPATGRLAGVDYGTVRIGLAVTDPDRTLASPAVSYTRRGLQGDAAYFKQFAKEERVVGFVVGLPIHLDGRESQKSREAREFAAWLGKLTDLPVALFDERFSSAQAEEMLMAAELTSKRRKARRDMLAAQILLSAYLEAGRGRTNPGGLDDRG